MAFLRRIFSGLGSGDKAISDKLAVKALVFASKEILGFEGGNTDVFDHAPDVEGTLLPSRAGGKPADGFGKFIVECLAIFLIHSFVITTIIDLGKLYKPWHAVVFTYTYKNPAYKYYILLFLYLIYFFAICKEHWREQLLCLWRSYVLSWNIVKNILPQYVFKKHFKAQ